MHHFSRKIITDAGKSLDLIHVTGYHLLVEETAADISPNNSILLSRNHPVAIIVGAAGFIGSRLTEKLLELGVQVIGVDNLVTGRKENLADSFKHKNFHFFHLSIEEAEVAEVLKDLPHLDYAIFIAENPSHSSLYKNGLPNFLKIVKTYKKGEENSKTERPKVVFMSSIAVYDSSAEGRLNYLKGAENQFAKFIKSHGLNGRIVRLAEVFGPRMHFRQNDSLSRLIKLHLEGKLNKDEGLLDFSTRGLFIDDAVSLILKSILSGSTSGKIFDGCLLAPVKIEEIKQILLSYDTYHIGDFSLSDLPPWPTPNLVTAIKSLAWKPKTNFVAGLKMTIEYFEQNPTAKEFALSQKQQQEKEKIKGWSFAEMENEIAKKEIKKRRKKSWANFFWLVFFFLFFLIGLVYPLGSFIIGSFSLPSSLKAAQNAIKDGDLVSAEKYLEYAKISNQHMNNLQPALGGLENLGVGEEAKEIDQLISAQNQALVGVDQTINGLKNLPSELGTGPKKDDLFLQAEQNLASALAFYANASLQQQNLIPNKSAMLDTSVLNYFYYLSQQGEKAEQILPHLTGKNYLLVVTDQGVPISLGEIVWQGSLKNTNLTAVADFDAQLAQKNIFITQNNLNTPARLSNLDPTNFPEFAQTVRNLDQSLTGQTLDGVIMMEKSAQQQLDSNPEQNFSQLVADLDQKQMVIFSTDPQLEKSLLNLGWDGAINFPQSADSFNDFLSVQTLPSLPIKYSLFSTIGTDGGLSHELTLSYQNPQARIVNLAIFLPLGSQLVSAQLNGNLTQLTSSVDFGLAKIGGSINLNSGPNQLLIKYNLAKKMAMGDQGVEYMVKINKQYGAAAADFSWQLNYPFSWDLISQTRGVDSTKHQISQQINLNSDQSFDLSFKKH